MVGWELDEAVLAAARECMGMAEIEQAGHLVCGQGYAWRRLPHPVAFTCRGNLDERLPLEAWKECHGSKFH